MDCRRREILLPLLAVVALCAAAVSSWAAAATRIELTDADTARTIASRTIDDGERVVLTWRNSLFGLDVTEVFVAAAGRLELTSVTFADPAGGEPPRVAPTDVDDLYHTGGPFRAEGLARPFGRILFRVGEIGNPVVRIADLRVHLLGEVGFGGRVLLVATPGPAPLVERGRPSPEPGPRARPTLP